MGENKNYGYTALGLGVTIIVSLVAIILAAVALSRQVSSPSITVVTSGGENGKTLSGGKRIWTVSHAHDGGAAEYIDESGYIQGFNLDLIRKVCEAANIDCRLVWDVSTNCWDSIAGQHPRPGTGIMDRWYDACSGWHQTVERNHSLAFSNSFKSDLRASFIVKKGNAVSFDGSDLAGRKIGFLDGWLFNEQCLARQQDENHRNYILPTENIVHISTAEVAVRYLTEEKVYAVLNSEPIFSKYDEVEVIRRIPEFSCALAGPAIMTRKDNDFITYFNMGLKKIMENGEYQKLCQEAKTKHGHMGETKCLDV